MSYQTANILIAYTSTEGTTLTITLHNLGVTLLTRELVCIGQQGRLQINSALTHSYLGVVFDLFDIHRKTMQTHPYSI